MDPQRAKQLLAQERARIEAGLAELDREEPLESDENVEPGDEGSEDLYLDEMEQAERERLQRDLEALERAEKRLAAGTYGLSVQSGQPIPDGRLQALPLAERTVEEEERYRRA